MASHIAGRIMKTTIDISDPLLRKARKVAARDGITLKNLVERGLKHVLDEPTRKKPFKLRDASFKGKGLRPELRDASWEQIRALIYEGRGG
jgi:hypothetical protein